MHLAQVNIIFLLSDAPNGIILIGMDKSSVRS